MTTGNATIHETPIRIPTYHIREDPNPPLFSAWDPWVYPYPKQDELLRPVDEEVTYGAVVMENLYLKVTVLPQLGGRVYSAYDKLTQREIFYRVPVIKPALIGLRGAWICGGIEFNFVKGHHVMTVSPVDHLVREHPDGSVSVTVGHMERASRARWNVTLTLHPDRAYLQTDLKLYNRYRQRLDFYQWSNSAVEANEHLFYPYPTDHVISSARRTMYFPEHGGADVSRWETIPVAHDLFSIGSGRDFMGIYYEDTDVGMVHYANHHEAPGQKIFTWGTDDAGRIWDYILADGDTPYAEPQAGAVVDQSTFLFLEPHQTIGWRDYWWSIRNMRGYTEVNANAALNMAPAGADRTLLAANVTHDYTGAHLTLLVGGQVMAQETVDLTPETPYCQEIDLAPAAWRYAEVRLIVCDAAGKEIIQYHKPAPSMFEPIVVPEPFQPTIDARSTTEECVIAANEAEKLREWERAETLYDQVLADDPGHARAHAHLGMLRVRQGLYAAACEHLMAALVRNPDLGMAHYHLGIALRERGDLAGARTQFWAVRLDPAYNSQGYYYLGEMALAESEPEAAIALFRRSLDLNRAHIKGHDMLAVALRAAGRAREAAAVLDGVLNDDEGLDITDVMAQAERWFLSPTEAERQMLLSRIGDDVQVLLELAADYAGIGYWDEASRVLKLWPGVCEGDLANPMIYYGLGYYADKRGDAAEATRLYALGASMPADRVFPHRVEALDVLARAIIMNPDDAHALGYRGTLLYALRRKEEAMASWQAAIAIAPSAVVHRNLGKALWQDADDLTAARAHYEAACELAPEDHRLFSDLYDVLTAMDAPVAERIAVLERAPQHGRVQARLVAALVDAERWDDAVGVLTEMQFDPYEGERGTRPAYYQAYLGRGTARYRAGDLAGALGDLESALAYPRNVGVGRSHYAQDAEASYWAGMAAEGLDDGERARAHWQQGAATRPLPRYGVDSPREGYDPRARHFVTLCLQKLGRARNAAELF